MAHCKYCGAYFNDNSPDYYQWQDGEYCSSDCEYSGYILESSGEDVLQEAIEAQERKV